MGTGVRRFLAAVLVCGAVNPMAAQVGAPNPQPCERAVPRNITASPALLVMLERLTQESSTLKAQCARIGESPRMRVRLVLDGCIRTSFRAFSVIERRHGALRAEVHVPPVGMVLGELVGHEFEHILEQMEAVDLRRLSNTRGSGVREIDRGVFETDRAQRVGKTVAQEVQSSRSSARAN